MPLFGLASGTGGVAALAIGSHRGTGVVNNSSRASAEAASKPAMEENSMRKISTFAAVLTFAATAAAITVADPALALNQKTCQVKYDGFGTALD
ncbi:hypothetical protein [Actinoplanes sp. NPDC026670]|uniref:hypothetical protein n=1 Tax=Actinoplanes sp. NPDC026670 TaxID=3154700 RepID=UPI0033C81D71